MRRRALLARTALLTTPPVALAGCSGSGDPTATESPTDSPTSTPTESSTPTRTATDSPTPTPSTVKTPASGSLAVAEHALVRSNEGSDGELVGVDAAVENTGDDAVTGVRVVARFLDEAGELLDESEARTDRIAAGGRWEIELLFGGSGADARAVADYRLLIERVD